MVFPVPPNDPNTPIPNNPFYYPRTNNIQSDFGPLIIGTGLNIDYDTGILSANDPGTPAGVTALLAGPGILLDANTGIVTVTNTGVTDIQAGNGISVTNVGGTYTITNITQGGGNGTVCQVNAGAGLTGGTITTVGTIALAQTAVGPGTYTNPTITVDEYGRITYAAPGTAAGAFPVQATFPLQSDGLLPSTLSIAAASTTARGSVQLNDTVTSTSTLQAGTANSVRCAYQQANTANTIALDARTKANTADARSIAACSAAQSASADAGTALTVATVAQGTADGAVIDAANAQSTANTACALAVTACGVANTALLSANDRIACGAFQDIGEILVGCGAGHWQAIPVGSEGQVLTVCGVCPSGVTWAGGSLPGQGPVTLIQTGPGLTGGPICTVGTISVASTGVTPGLYSNASLCVNDRGQVTYIVGSSAPPVLGVTGSAPIQVNLVNDVVNISVASATGAAEGVVRLYNGLDSNSALLALTAQQGKVLQDQITQVCADKISSVSGVSPISVTAGLNPAVSVADGTTLNKGVVQLYDALDSTSTTLALTANQGKNLQDQINSLSVLSDLTFAGTINASTGLMLTVSQSGSAAGFVVGQVLPLPGTANANYFAITEVGGTFTPPGAAAPLTATQGDWLLSDGAAWSVVNVGFDPPYATDTTSGLVQLSTNSETQAGLEATHAVTPATLQSKVSDSTALQSSTTIASSTAVKDAYDVAVAAIPKAIIASAVKGTLLTSTGANNVTALPPGTNGYVLKSDSNEPTGLCWGTSVCSVTTGTGLTGGIITNTGTIALADTSVTSGTYAYPSSLQVDQQGRLLNVIGGIQPITCQDFDAKGDILVGFADDSYGTLAITPNAGYVLTSAPSQATGMQWALPSVPTPAYGNFTLVNNVAVASGGNVTPIGFNCHQFYCMGWNNANPEQICFTEPGTYMWTVSASFCWDAGAPNLVCAYLNPQYNGNPGFYNTAFETAVLTGGDSGFSSFTFNGITPPSPAGSYMQFAVGLTHTGCLYSSVLCSSRMSVNIQRVGY